GRGVPPLRPRGGGPPPERGRSPRDVAAPRNSIWRAAPPWQARWGLAKTKRPRLLPQARPTSPRSRHGRDPGSAGTSERARGLRRGGHLFDRHRTRRGEGAGALPNLVAGVGAVADDADDEPGAGRAHVD